jgi:hypothetical protein
MPISNWFPTLGDPSATEDAITKKCFDSITSAADDSFGGRFSSHHTDTSTVCTLLNNLNALGKELNDRLTQIPAPIDLINEIAKLRTKSEVSAQTADLAYFCTLLKDKDVVVAAVVDPIINALCSLRLATAVETKGITHRPLYTGISVYLPKAASPDVYPTSQLPQYFHDHVQEWVKFLDTWIRVTSP